VLRYITLVCQSLVYVEIVLNRNPPKQPYITICAESISIVDSTLELIQIFSDVCRSVMILYAQVV